MNATATATVANPLEGKTLEVNTETGKVVGADKKAPAGEDKGNVVKLPQKAGTAKAKTPAKTAKKTDDKKLQKAANDSGATKLASPKKGKKITLVAKDCPAKKGSNRAKLWAKLKTGMTLDDAKEAGIPLRFIKKMAKKDHLKIG